VHVEFESRSSSLNSLQQLQLLDRAS